MQRILFITENDGNAKLYLSIAMAFSAIDPEIECVLVDVSSYFPGCVCGDYVFERCRLRSVVLTSDGKGYPEFLRQFRRLFELEKPSIVVVPHELGHASVAVALARYMGILTYQIQHGDYLPEYFTGENPPVHLQEVTEEKPAPISLSDHGFRIAQWRIVREEFSLLRKTVCSTMQRIGQPLMHRNLVEHNGRMETDDALSQLMSDLKLSPDAGSRYTFTTDKVGVNGPYHRRRLLDLGLSEDRIDLIGNLRYDYLLQQPQLSCAALCQKYAMDSTLPLILYFYSPVEDAYQLRHTPIDAIRDAVNSISANGVMANILILNHPRKPAEILEPIMKWGNPHLRVGYVEDNFRSLSNAALLIMGVMSAAFTEALPAQKPILTQNYILESQGNTTLVEYGAVIPVFHRHHLADQVGRAIKDHSFLRRLAQNQAVAADELLGPRDGKCGERAAFSLAKMIEIRARQP